MSNGLNIKPFNASLQKLALTFTSKNQYLDSFLKSPDSLDEKYGKSYVWLNDSEEIIIGYYNITTGMISDENGAKLGGAIHITSFALDEKYQGSIKATDESGTEIKLSDLLLSDCLERIEFIRNTYVGFGFVTLFSTNEGYSLYLRNGFEELDDSMIISSGENERECTPMYYCPDWE